MRVGAYTMEDEPGVLMDRLEAARVADKKAERRVRILGWLLAATVIFSCGGVFFVGAIAERLTGPRSVGIALAPLVAVVVLLGYSLARAKSEDLDDRKLETAIRVVGVLRADIAPGKRVHLKLDFRPYTTSDRKSKEAGVSKYRQSWFRAAAPLADGTDFFVEITDLASRREKSKRKYTKVTERFSSLLAFSLKPDKRYGDPESLVKAVRSAPAPPSLSVQRLSHKGRRLVAVLKTPRATRVKGRIGTTARGMEHLANGDAVLRSLRWFYRGISSTRRPA